MAKLTWNGILENQRGAVLVEFGVILPLFFVMMLFFIICYDMVHSQIEMQVEAYAGMRRATMRLNGSGKQHDVQLVECVNEKVFVIPRGMQKIVKIHTLPLRTSVCSYAGVMRNEGKSAWEDGCGDRYWDGINHKVLNNGCQ